MMRACVLVVLFFASVSLASHASLISRRDSLETGVTDHRHNYIEYTTMETDMAVSILDLPGACKAVEDYVSILEDAGAFHPHKREHVIPDVVLKHNEKISTLKASFKMAEGFFQNLKKAIAERSRAGDEKGRKDACRWLYTFLQIDFNKLVQFYLKEKTDLELFSFFPHVSTEDLSLIQDASNKLSFNDIRNFYAERRKAERARCYLPDDINWIECGERESQLQQKHPIFSDIRGRNGRPKFDENKAMSPEERKVHLRRLGSIENRLPGIVASEYVTQGEFFKLPVVHAGKSLFDRAEFSFDQANMAATMDYHGVPFIAGPSGTAKQVALTLEATEPQVPFKDRERILMAFSMLVLAGGHHSFGELLIGMQIMGYGRKIPSLMRLYSEGYFPDLPFMMPLEWSNPDNVKAHSYVEKLMTHLARSHYNHRESARVFLVYAYDMFEEYLSEAQLNRIIPPRKADREAEALHKLDHAHDHEEILERKHRLRRSRARAV